MNYWINRNEDMAKSTLEKWKTTKETFHARLKRFSEPTGKQIWRNLTTTIKKLQDNGHGILLGSDAPQLLMYLLLRFSMRIKDAKAGLTSFLSNYSVRKLYKSCKNTLKLWMNSGQLKKGLISRILNYLEKNLREF